MKPPVPHTDAYGVVSRYQDASRRWHRIRPATQRAVLAAMGVEPTGAIPPSASSVRVLRAGRAERVSGPAELRLEDGTVLAIQRQLPPDLPIGYHELHPSDGGSPTRLIVSPGVCHRPAELQAWGWAVQLYALRSRRSWGLGDLADLRALARWSARELGAGFLMLNPLSAPLPILPQEPSPYYPSSRLFHNPLFLRIEEVPGAAETRLPLGKLAAAGRALNQERQIERDAVFKLKRRALETIWRRFAGDDRFSRFCAEQGEALQQFATYCALAEQFGAGWDRWPSRYQRPASPAVRRFVVNHAQSIAFHQWLQWLLDLQLARAARALPLMQDLPIGVNPAGADAWAWQDLLARDVSVGAPPDQFNTLGQDWGLPPFIPHRLRDAGYEPFRQTLRAAMRHAGGLRIDHVMGLFRLFWIPRGSPPAAGAFVRFRAEELLAVVAIESTRARAIVVGEDLGTVEAGVRAQLRRHQILSYCLLWFEQRQPHQYPKEALAAVTTHDLFTVAGLWSGSDLASQQRLGLAPNVRDTLRLQRRLARQLRLSQAAPLPDVIQRIHERLATAPCRLLTATLDDALEVAERPNMPGTTSQWPNWSIGLPKTLEQLTRSPLAKQIGAALARRAAPPCSK